MEQIVKLTKTTMTEVNNPEWTKRLETERGDEVIDSINEQAGKKIYALLLRGKLYYNPTAFFTIPQGPESAMKFEDRMAAEFMEFEGETETKNGSERKRQEYFWES